MSSYSFEAEVEDEDENGSEADLRKQQDEADLVRGKIFDFFAGINAKTKDEQDKHYESYQKYICPQPEEVKKHITLAPRNVLYKIAQDGKKNEDTPEAWVVSRLARDYPALLEDGNGERALYVAIKHKMVWFVRCILESSVPSKTLCCILGPTPEDSQTDQSFGHLNCISEAIRQNLETSVTIKLINAACEYTLEAQDQAGKTPLHYAVESRRCKGKQLDVIQALLNKGDKALDKRTCQPDFFSVYQYHFYSRKQKKASSTFLKRRNMSKGDSTNASRKAGATKNSVSERKNGDEDTGGKEAGSENDNKKSLHQNSKEKEKSEQLALGSPGNTKDGRNQANEGRPLSDTQSKAHGQSIKGPSTTSQTRAGPNSNVDKGKNTSSKECQEEVAKLLKLHYLRTTFRSKTTRQTLRDHNSAEIFLFGDIHENKYLCFTFPPKPQRPTTKYYFDDFKKGYGSMSFDPVLLYVDFGIFDLQATGIGPRSQVQDGPTGKQYLWNFFDWLFKKGVRYIIKVMVAENKDTAHCNETIIKSLKLFDVEILDWQKVDLCPSVIQQASEKWSNFHELHLLWSGSNAVLRAWSEPEGLALVKNLKTIHIYEAKIPLDSRKYINTRMEEFTTRLNASRRKSNSQHLVKVEHHPFKSSRGERDENPKSKSQESNQAKASEKIDEHQWLNIMDTFADGIRSLEAQKPPRYNGNFLDDCRFPESLKKEVTVALIDDGVDFMNPAVSSNLIGGKCFPNEFNSHEVVGAPDPPFHGSTTEHGTNMAYMIRRICPAVKIFVCKIDVMRRSGQKANFTAKSAADAVEYAVKQGYDIISMSWSIKQDETDKFQKGHLNRLREALTPQKNRKKPLLFCSAPDIGQSSTKNRYYPFGCDEIQNIFKIGAATADGSTHRWTGHEVHYILPGEKVLIRKEGEVDPGEGDCPKTGSSIATALAAGLAALIIHCVRLGAIYSTCNENKSGMNSKTLEAVKTFEVMKHAFDTLKLQGTSAGAEKRLGVESFFASPGKKLSRNDDLHDSQVDDEKWADVEKLARDLVPYTSL